MFPFGSRLGAPSRLPRSVPPFPGETTASYLYRLAVANQLRPGDLQAYLIGRREPGSVTLDTLATATGRSPHSLSRALPELGPGFDPAAAAHVRRTICWRCAARRGAFRFAITWRPAEVNLCSSHQVWLGPPVRATHGPQYNVGDVPEIIQAQRRHCRLARQRGRHTAAAAFAEAAHITALWARHGFHRDRRAALIGEFPGRSSSLTGRLPRGHPITPVVTYPETVDLAHVLAMPRWRDPAVCADGDSLRQFQQDIDHHVGIHYLPEDSPYDPLFRWFQKRREIKG